MTENICCLCLAMNTWRLAVILTLATHTHMFLHERTGWNTEWDFGASFRSRQLSSDLYYLRPAVSVLTWEIPKQYYFYNLSVLGKLRYVWF